MSKVGVLIATSMNRIDFLIHRSLESVINQTSQPNCIVIVDDNLYSKFEENRCKILQLGIPNLFYIKNEKTKNMSGCGAWNTGLAFLKNKLGEDTYVAILDDDDSWESTQLETCLNELKSKNYKAVFTFLKRGDCDNISMFSKNDLTIDRFLIGNPGVQGSNMFFQLKSLFEIGCFDEELSSCTDRDLMIRFLLNNSSNDISIVPRLLVNHYTGHQTVTSNYLKKEMGLDVFYRKFIHLFSEKTLEKSLERAERFFQYKHSTKIKSLFYDKIVIGIAIHNNSGTIRRCLSSVLYQENTKRKIIAVIGDDNSNDNWQDEVGDLLAEYKQQIIIVPLNNTNTVKTRNDINNYIVKNIKSVALIGRLDSDDEFSDLKVFSEIERKYEEFQPDLILAGNYLRVDNKVIERVNKSTSKLLDRGYLLNRLKEMEKGVVEAELPSCNLFISPKCIELYPNIKSAEDHSLLVNYLLKKEQYNWCFAEDLLAVIYSLSGSVTVNNKKNDSFIACRKSIYQNYKNGKE